MMIRLTVCAVLPLAPLAAGDPVTATYCNPLPLPDYPLGREARGIRPGAPAPEKSLWLLDRVEPFRELADPSALFAGGVWYLYPSVDMAWTSRDNGATWEHHPLNVRDIGYAPTVTEHRGRFLMLASGSQLHAGDTPLGPFRPLGRIDFRGVVVPGQTDPMLFSDRGGKLYYYWGCSERGGIWGVELDAADPCRTIGRPAEVIPFDPAGQPWERLGEANQIPTSGWMEGSWMYRRGDTYYLTYSAAGTQNRTYAIGCAVSGSPLGPFRAQRRNPVLRSTEGLITGTGHGCVVDGPGGEPWVFYTIRAGVAHGFERRIGMDRAVIDGSGELQVPRASSTPQRLPGAGVPEGDTGWLPLTLNGVVRTSSCAPNLPGRLAVDDELRSWWQPDAEDSRPELTVRLGAEAEVRALRVVWRDVGLGMKPEAQAGAFQYRVEVQDGQGSWTTWLDATDNRRDLLVDYRECPARRAKALRLRITGHPPGITPGVAEFTAFGVP